MTTKGDLGTRKPQERTSCVCEEPSWEPEPRDCDVKGCLGIVQPCRPGRRCPLHFSFMIITRDITVVLSGMLHAGPGLSHLSVLSIQHMYVSGSESPRQPQAPSCALHHPTRPPEVSQPPCVGSPNKALRLRWPSRWGSPGSSSCALRSCIPS